MMKKKVCISIAVWGSEYIKTFVKYNLATQLSKDNIPSIASFCDVTYHIITTNEDRAWLEAQPLIEKLKTYCQIDWESIDSYHQSYEIPTGIGGEKYFFLSLLQNAALKRASKLDILIFNYADFIWSDGSIRHLVLKFEEKIEAVLTFCLPVDHDEGVEALDRYAIKHPREDGIIEFNARDAAEIALNSLHREAQRRYWDDKKFTVTPTYILWPVGKEGIVITAYHQTILAMRVNSNNPFYHNGIITSSLDGYYSAVLAANSQITHADNSDEIFVFSLYDTVVSSAITNNMSREDSIRQCLKGSVTEKQRDLAIHCIEVRKNHSNSEQWVAVKEEAKRILNQLHQGTPFDPERYAEIYFNGQVKLAVDHAKPSVPISQDKPGDKKRLLPRIKYPFLKGISLLQGLAIDCFASKNVILNGNFDSWTGASLNYAGGAWVDLPAKHWLGHFDNGAQGVFQLSRNTPNYLSRYSIEIKGAAGGTFVYFAQRVPAVSMLHIRKTGFLSCSGYVRCEGETDKIIGLNLIIPNERDDYSSYVAKTLRFIKIKEANAWVYFDLEFKNIKQEQLSKGGMFYFLLGGLESPEDKIYFSQLRFSSVPSAQLKPGTSQQEKFLKQKLNILLYLEAQKRKWGRYLGRPKLAKPVSDDSPANPLNNEYAHDLLEKQGIDALLEQIKSHMHPLFIGYERLLDQTAAAYYWIGLLTERVMNNITSLNTLESLFVNTEEALHRLISLSPRYVEGYRALARNLWMQGRHQESLQLFQRAEEKRIEFANSVELDPNAAVILPVNCVHVIGLMGHLDAFIKRKILLNDSRPYHLVAEPQEIVNSVFFDYWKPFLELGLPQIDKTPSALQLAYTVNWNWAMPETSASVAHVHTSIARVQRQWAQENREPLLTLHADHQQTLRDYQSSLGMKEDDWFVCLHVRSASFYGDKAGGAQDFRNTPIEDYYLAIQSVVEAGGWVIRMGEADSPPLKLDSNLLDTTRVIDYAHSSDRSALLDVALSASCRLFISSPSGLHTVAHAFGRPVCYVNYPIYAGFPWHPNEIFLPMLYYSMSKHQVLSMHEILSSNLVYADHYHLLTKEKVVLLRNTPDEIEQTVMEALLGERYYLFDSSIAKNLREEFQQLNRTYGRDISGQVSLYFANKHREKLFTTPETLKTYSGESHVSVEIA